MQDDSFSNLVLSLCCEPAILFSEVIIKETTKPEAQFSHMYNGDNNSTYCTDVAKRVQ